MSEKNKKIKLLLSKLRSSLHLEFICNNILKCDKLECLDILNELVEQNIIEEKNKIYKLK